MPSVYSENEVLQIEASIKRSDAKARKFGIHSAMPMKIARRLCSHASVVRGDMEAYRIIMDIPARCPMIEIAHYILRDYVVVKLL